MIDRKQKLFCNTNKNTAQVLCTKLLFFANYGSISDFHTVLTPLWDGIPEINSMGRKNHVFF